MKTLAPLIAALCSLPFAACRSTHTEQPTPEPSAASVPPADLKVRSLTMVDEAGKPRLTIKQEIDIGAKIAFLDATGEPVASMYMIDPPRGSTRADSQGHGFFLEVNSGDPGYSYQLMLTPRHAGMSLHDDDGKGAGLHIYDGKVTVDLSATGKEMSGIFARCQLVVEDGRVVLKSLDGKELGSMRLPTEMGDPK